MHMAIEELTAASYYSISKQQYINPILIRAWHWGNEACRIVHACAMENFIRSFVIDWILDAMMIQIWIPIQCACVCCA